MQGALHDALQVVEFEGLGEVIKGAQFHGLDGGLDAAVAGDHDDLGEGILLAAFLDDLEAVEVGDAEVDDEEFGAEAFEAEEAIAAGLEEENVVAHAASHLADQLQDGSFVVNNCNIGHEGGEGRGEGGGAGQICARSR